MKKNHYVIALALLLIFWQVAANSTITFFFKPFHDKEHMIKTVTKPGNLAHHTVHGILQHTPVAGLLVTYGGYVATSNYNGEIIFPRKHQKPIITLVITPEMEPVPLFENTLLHWDFLPTVPAKMYSCELKHNSITGQSYWDTQEVALPEDKKIPLSAIVIIADPKNIIMNVGTTLVTETANLVLPDVYVKKGINIVENSSYMLVVRHLFRPVESAEHREPFKIITHVID